MAIDFSLMIYEPCEIVFGRPITVTAHASRAGAVYAARGIIDTRGTVVQTDAGMAVLSDQETICDIRERDYGFDGNPPVQGDEIDVPPDGEITDMVGTYVVTDMSWNGGGEVTLILQRKTDPTSIGTTGYQEIGAMNVQRPPDEDTGNAGDETDVQSYSYIIWEWIYQRLRNDPFFENFVVRRATAALPVELWAQVPFLGVYLIEDPLTPPGGIFNQSHVALVHNVKVGFQFILRNNDSEMLLRDLDRVKWFILRTILRDDDLTNRFDTKLPGGTAFNGISGGRIRMPRWGLTGQKNETPIGEQQIELTFHFETTWYPYGFPDLERIDITTGFPGPGSTPEERAEIVQAKLVILFNPDYVPTPLPPDTEPPGPPPGSP